MSTAIEAPIVQRDEKGRLMPGSVLNPGGTPKASHKALKDIEDAIIEFEKEKGVSYWKAATLIAMKLANDGNTTLLSKILDKFVSSRILHEGGDTGIMVIMPTVKIEGNPQEIKIGA